MSVVFFRIAVVLYLGSAAAGFASFLLPKAARALLRAASVLLLAGFGVHTVAIGVGCAHFGGRELFSLAGGLALISWFGAAVSLGLLRLARLPAVGAFVVPFLVFALAPAAIAGLAAPELQPALVREPALQLHVASSALAVALFAAAAGVSVMYLLQQRQLKLKRFGRLFAGLPSLETLLRLSRLVLRAGFISYCVSFLSGILAAEAIWSSGWSWDPQLIASVLVLGVYGTVAFGLPGRWQPRRRALVTVVAFAVAIMTMVALRVGAAETLHRGDYGMGELVSR